MDQEDQLIEPLTSVRAGQEARSALLNRYVGLRGQPKADEQSDEPKETGRKRMARAETEQTARLKAHRAWAETLPDDPVDAQRRRAVDEHNRTKRLEERNRQMVLTAQEADFDKRYFACLDALNAKAGLSEPNSEGGPELRYHTFCDLGKEMMRGAGMDSAQIAGGGDAYAAEFLIGATGGINTPGGFPDLMSALAGKIINTATPGAEASYKRWCHQLPPVKDFKPKTIISLGEFPELPYHPDGDDFEDSTFATELGWLRASSYGDEFRLSPQMIQDDDAGAFVRAVRDKIKAHDATLNRMAVGMLTLNAALLDGYALYDSTNHGNDRTSGGAPSTSELDAMRQLLRKQQGVSAKRYESYELAVLLVPVELETTAEQLLRATLQTHPTTDANTGPFRGVTSYVVEPILSDDSAVKYYGFAPPSEGRAICYAHMMGFEKMKLRSYINPRNQCRHYQSEGRFCVCAVNYRGSVRNAGA
ncbi:MAG: phage major capsid protein [Planctomycetota bacterium]|jgi:hypothetical protein